MLEMCFFGRCFADGGPQRDAVLPVTTTVEGQTLARTASGVLRRSAPCRRAAGKRARTLGGNPNGIIQYLIAHAVHGRIPGRCGWNRRTSPRAQPPHNMSRRTEPIVCDCTYESNQRPMQRSYVEDIVQYRVNSRASENVLRGRQIFPPGIQKSRQPDHSKAIPHSLPSSLRDCGLLLSIITPSREARRERIDVQVCAAWVFASARFQPWQTVLSATARASHACLYRCAPTEAADGFGHRGAEVQAILAGRLSRRAIQWSTRPLPIAFLPLPFPLSLRYTPKPARLRAAFIKLPP